MFVLSNLSTGGIITITTTGSDLFTSNNTSTILINPGSSVTIYSVYVQNATSFWAVQA
jgi:hypothetical protein